jgi:non-specific protein-tyrosine kinase
MADHIGLVTIDDPMAPASESYRSLRMNLQFAALDRKLRTLLITSPGPSEGKTTTLANLAVTMAQMEQRVVIVDCDLRRPYLNKLFGLGNDTGVTTMMVDDEALANPPLQETSIEGLRLLASGPLPPRPSDLLGSRAWARSSSGCCRTPTSCSLTHRRSCPPPTPPCWPPRWTAYCWW